MRQPEEIGTGAATHDKSLSLILLPSVLVCSSLLSTSRSGRVHGVHLVSNNVRIVILDDMCHLFTHRVQGRQ